MYCLPSNTTHELQPLDKAVYRSFEHHWDAEVLSFLDQNRDKKLTKARFNIILSSVWSKCRTNSNITSGFRATGLYPFNPQDIPETTVHCNFHRTVYGTSSSSEESDGLPLIQLKRNDFYDLLPTPVKVQTKIPTKRRKAINYRSTAVTKDLFDKYNDEKRKPSNKRKKNRPEENFSEGKKYRTEKEKSKNTSNQKKAKIVSAKKSAAIKDTTQYQSSWYCHACEEDRMDDAMRKCSRCSKWYHEECVGLSVDTDDFQCPGGC